MSNWFTTTWASALFAAGSTVAMYVSVLVAVRVAGRRTLAQLSAFDAIVTIALGSIIATTVVSRDPPYLQSISAVLTLLTLQVLLGAARRRWSMVSRLTDFEPLRVVEGGKRQQHHGPLSTQLTDGELHSKLRSRGAFDITEVDEAILEPDGELSVRMSHRTDS